MFIKNPNLISLDDEIFLYPSFISQDELINIFNNLNLQEDSLYLQSAKNEWYNNKLTKKIQPLLSVYAKIKDLVYPEYEILPDLSITRLETGQSMYVHADSPGEDSQDIIYSDDPYGTCHVVKYGTVVYLNDDYSGGEIYYPKRNISYKPKAGDLIIHSAFDEYSHGVKEVLSGTRYVYANFMIPFGKKEIPKLV